MLGVDKYEDSIQIAIYSFMKALVIERRNELCIMLYISGNSLWIFNGRKIVL
jgi:hypothetical protein